MTVEGQCAGCSALRQELAALQATFASHVQWATRAERLVALEKRLEEQGRHAQELRILEEAARALAHARLNERLSDMNELRTQTLTERGMFISRAEYEAKHSALVNDVASMSKNHAAQDDLHHVEVSRRVNELENWRSAQDATRVALQRVAAIFGAVAGGLAGFLSTMFHR